MFEFTSCVRTFEIIATEDYGHFYGARVGERFTTTSVDSSGDLWLDPKQNACIREDNWKDMPELCILIQSEIGVYVKEIVE